LNFEPPSQHPSIAILEHFCWFGDDVQFSFFTSISGISWRRKQSTGSLVINISNRYKATFIIFLGCVLIISLIAQDGNFCFKSRLLELHQIVFFFE
jgi:hypothetical protein